MGHDVLPAATWTIGDYPRHLHKGAGEFVVVQNDTERDQRLAEGWHLWPYNDWRRAEERPVAVGVDLASAEIDRTVVTPRRRGRPKKTADETP